MPSLRSIKISYSYPPPLPPPCEEPSPPPPPPPPPPHPPCSPCQHRKHSSPPPPPPPLPPPPKMPPPKVAPPRPSPPLFYPPGAQSPYFVLSPASQPSIAPFAPPGNHTSLVMATSLGSLFFLSFVILGLEYFLGMKDLVSNIGDLGLPPGGGGDALTAPGEQPQPRKNVPGTPTSHVESKEAGDPGKEAGESKETDDPGKEAGEEAGESKETDDPGKEAGESKETDDPGNEAGESNKLQTLEEQDHEEEEEEEEEEKKKKKKKKKKKQQHPKAAGTVIKRLKETKIVLEGMLLQQAAASNNIPHGLPAQTPSQPEENPSTMSYAANKSSEKFDEYDDGSTEQEAEVKDEDHKKDEEADGVDELKAKDEEADGVGKAPPRRSNDERNKASKKSRAAARSSNDHMNHFNKTTTTKLDDRKLQPDSAQQDLMVEEERDGESELQEDNPDEDEIVVGDDDTLKLFTQSVSEGKKLAGTGKAGRTSSATLVAARSHIKTTAEDNPDEGQEEIQIDDTTAADDAMEISGQSTSLSEQGKRRLAVAGSKDEAKKRPQPGGKAISKGQSPTSNLINHFNKADDQNLQHTWQSDQKRVSDEGIVGHREQEQQADDSQAIRPEEEEEETPGDCESLPKIKEACKFFKSRKPAGSSNRSAKQPGTNRGVASAQILTKPCLKDLNKSGDDEPAENDEIHVPPDGNGGVGADEEDDDENWLAEMGDFDPMGAVEQLGALFLKWSNAVEWLVEKNAELAYELQKKIKERDSSRAGPQFLLSHDTSEEAVSAVGDEEQQKAEERSELADHEVIPDSSHKGNDERERRVATTENATGKHDSKSQIRQGKAERRALNVVTGSGVCEEQEMVDVDNDDDDAAEEHQDFKNNIPGVDESQVMKSMEETDAKQRQEESEVMRIVEEEKKPVNSKALLLKGGSDEGKRAAGVKNSKKAGTREQAKADEAAAAVSSSARNVAIESGVFGEEQKMLIDEARQGAAGETFLQEYQNSNDTQVLRSSMEEAVIPRKHESLLKEHKTTVVATKTKVDHEQQGKGKRPTPSPSSPLGVSGPALVEMAIDHESEHDRMIDDIEVKDLILQGRQKDVGAKAGHGRGRHTITSYKRQAAADDEEQIDEKLLSDSAELEVDAAGEEEEGATTVANAAAEEEEEEMLLLKEVPQHSV